MLTIFVINSLVSAYLLFRLVPRSPMTSNYCQTGFFVVYHPIIRFCPVSDDLHHNSFFSNHEAENNPLKCLDKSKDLESKVQSISSSFEQENTTELRNRISTYQVATGDICYDLHSRLMACVKSGIWLQRGMFTSLSFGL